MSVLDRIVDDTRDEVKRRRKERAAQGPREGARAPRRGLPAVLEALTRPGVSLIAEHKRRSPSAGKIRKGSKVADVVQAYERGGAAALSILTEPFHFGGSLDDLREARAAATLPVLRKDFIVDKYQLYEAAAAGADAILLIVAALDDKALGQAAARGRRRSTSTRWSRSTTSASSSAALEFEADVLGINNRDLSDFSVDIERTYELLADVPAGKTVVSESGFSHPRAARRARARRRRRRPDRRDADARPGHRAGRARAHRRHRPAMTKVKICGITRLEDAELAISLGAWALGFILWEPSKRYVNPAVAAGHHPRRCGARSSPSACSSTSRSTRSPTASTSSASRTCSCTATRARRSAPPSPSGRARRSSRRCGSATPPTCATSSASTPTSTCSTRRQAGLYGGTGKTWDWKLVAQPPQQDPADPLGRADARRTSPRRSRRSSRGASTSRRGVEASPGIKDPEKLEAFFAAVRVGVHVAT